MPNEIPGTCSLRIRLAPYTRLFFWRLRLFSLRLESVVEYPVAPFLPLGDPLYLAPPPMDAEIDPALAILFFGLGKRVERTGKGRAYVAAVIAGNPVKLV